LPENIDKRSLDMVFSNYGRVEDLHIMTGKSKTGQAAAFVVYADEFSAKQAVAAMAQGYEIRPGEGNITVRFADDKGRGKGDDRSRPY